METVPVVVQAARAAATRDPKREREDRVNEKSKLSPMMQQYMAMKEQYKDTLLFFRLGDFYEMFFDDAVLASKELELTLTGRDCGMQERAPMCGVPFHAVDVYVNRLLEKGYKVAICEQLTDPALSKGLVDRDVVRIITPGTVIESSILDEKSNNYLLALYLQGTQVGMAYVDVSTGQFELSSVSVADGAQPLLDELVRLTPTEVLVNEAMGRFFKSHDVLQKVLAYPVQVEQEDNFEQLQLMRQFKVESLAELGLDDRSEACAAAGALLEYLAETQKNTLDQIQRPKIHRQNEFMLLDATTRRNLELTETLRGKNRKGSLLWILDRTHTAMGSRMLRQWLAQPLQNRLAIEMRLDAVEEISRDLVSKDRVIELLRQIKDIERIATRICYETVNARDCVALGNSVSVIPALKQALNGYAAAMVVQINQDMDPLEDVSDLLARAIADNPPLGVKDGGIIREGYDAQLDQLRHAATHGREMIASMEASEREATGIKNLKISYNRVFGFYIEVTKSYLDQVPYRYTRKQTLANAERFITQELKELEETILGAEEKSIKLEYELFVKIREALHGQIARLQRTARCVAQLDCLVSLADTALEHGFTKPTLNDQGELTITDGRHPVVEASLETGRFVANNTQMDMDKNRFLIITGPNMAGKSTYLRQVALITLMAHMGSFVPALSANIPLTDRIFTRIGATDDLFMGQSTFMVEMSEVANILKHATSQSLVILDEIGRGTSTFDGLSIAWAVVEYLCDRDAIGAKTLFATHYHELSQLEGKVAGVRNYCVAVREAGDTVVFLHRIVRGGADKSFGVHVAQLAGLPEAVVARAREILERLEASKFNSKAVRSSADEAGKRLNRPEDTRTQQMDFAALLPYHDILEEIKALDVDQMTPIDALYLVNRLKEKMK